MAEATGGKGESKKDIKKALVGVFCSEFDLKNKDAHEVKKKISDAINVHRPEEHKLEPTTLIVVRGGDVQTRDVNLHLLKTVCEAAMFRLCFESGGSSTTTWMKEESKGQSPFYFKEISSIPIERPDKEPLLRNGIAICSTGGYKAHS